MSGAVSFVLGLLGLGTAAGIDLGQSVSQKRKEAEMARECGWDAKGERAKMYERVRKEWYSIPDGHPNCLEKWRIDYPCDKGPAYRTKYWFKDHLDAKGIPYDDIILDEVTGVNYEKLLSRRMREAGKKRRGWF